MELAWKSKNKVMAVLWDSQIKGYYMAIKIGLGGY